MKSKFISAAILFFLLFNISFSQEHKSIHQLEQEKFGLKNEPLSKGNSGAEGIIPLNVQSVKNLKKAVFGYLPDWEYVADAAKYFHYDLLTHIACFDFTADSVGNIANPAYWPWTDVINAAHSKGVKIIMSVVNFNKKEIHKLITQSAPREKLIKNILTKIKVYKLDGVNIDFEGLYTSDRGTNIVSFLRILSDSVHTNFPGKEVSFASPAINWGGYWNFSAMADACDYLFIMGYDFYGKFSTYSGPTSPLVGGSHNLTNTVTSQYQSVVSSHPEKLILGLPYFGVHYQTESSTPGSKIIKYVESTKYSSSEAQSEVYGKLWSGDYKVPWYRWKDGPWNQVWYDDDSSLGLKYDLVDSKNLKGIGIWALGYDGARQELWDLINLRYGSGTLPAPSAPTEFRVVASTDSSLRLQFTIPKHAAAFKILMSPDGINFNRSADVVSNDVIISGLSPDSVYYFKVQATNSTGASPFTEVLGGIPGDSLKTNTLVVNGFDRVSGTTNTFDFIKRYGNPILFNNYKFVSSSNEAVFKGFVNLNNYKNVIWILADESTADETFNQYEQKVVKEFLQQGGNLLVSGSEVGWDLGRAGKSSSNDIYFYNNFLKAAYVNDAPEGDRATYYSAEPVSNSIFNGLGTINFDNGTHGTIDVDWPDAIKPVNGSKAALKYVGVSDVKGVAGVSFSGIFPGGSKIGSVVYLAFPFESIYPETMRTKTLQKVFKFFESTTEVNQSVAHPNNFTLYQNYPNPFNPSTTIAFYLPVNANVDLKIFNSLGQLVFSHHFGFLVSGNHKYLWRGTNNLGLKVASGFYIANLTVKTVEGNLLNKVIKMALIK